MSDFYGEPEYAPEGFGDEGGDELALVGKYFPETPAPAETSYDDDVEPSSATPEHSLVDEYRESNFDGDEVQGWRDVVNDVTAGEYSSDDFLSTYQDGEDEDDYSEADAEGLIDLGNGQVATPEEYAAGMAAAGVTPEQLVEAWAAENPNQQLMQSYLHLDHLNEVLAERDAQQEAQEGRALAAAASEAYELVAAANQQLGNINADANVVLEAANELAVRQQDQMRAAGYDEDTIAGYGPALAQAAIAQAAELMRDSHIAYHALKKV